MVLRLIQLYLILGQNQKNDPIVTATSITIFWEPVKVASVFEISISTEGYRQQRTLASSSQTQYTFQGLLPDTTYNVSLWFVALQESSNPPVNGPFRVFHAPITTRQLGKGLYN